MPAINCLTVLVVIVEHTFQYTLLRLTVEAFKVTLEVANCFEEDIKCFRFDLPCCNLNTFRKYFIV